MPTQYFMKYFQFYCNAVDEPPIVLATFPNFLWLLSVFNDSKKI